MRQALPPRLLQGAKRDDPIDGQVAVGAEDVPVAAKPGRWTYTGESERRLVRQADPCVSAIAKNGTLAKEPDDTEMTDYRRRIST